VPVSTTSRSIKLSKPNHLPDDCHDSRVVLGVISPGDVIISVLSARHIIEAVKSCLVTLVMDRAVLLTAILQFNGEAVIARVGVGTICY
jgi:hypothetical protein